MSVIGNMKSLTTDVGALIKQVKELRKEVKGLAGDAKGAMSTVKGVTGKGGQLALGESQTGNSLSSSLANISEPGGRQRGGPTNFLNAGMAQFTSNRFNTAAFMSMSATSAMAKGSAISAAVSGVGDIAKGVYNMTMDSSGIVNRATSYYQATLRAPGLSRKGVEAATFKALKGGITEVGGDAAVAGILAASGYTVGSKNYLGAAAQVGGAANYLGMGNKEAAGAIAGLQSGKFAANAYQYGITTMNPNGTYKSAGNIATQIMQTFSAGQKFTAKGINESYLKGNLGPILEGLGLNADQQQIIVQAMVDKASGRNPDLASKDSKSGGAGNTNPLDAALRMNTSQTGIQMASEKNTLKGLAGAAATVETFNRKMEDAIVGLSTLRGYLDGVSGTNVGKGAKSGLSGLKKLGGAALMIGGAAVTAASFGGATPLGLAMMGTGAGLAFSGGGGTPGYGGSFGANTGAKGGGTPQGSSANWMDKGDLWSSTGGNHLGTDYPAKEGTPVYAKGDGIVSSESISADYGNAVLITHNDGYQTLYAHLSNKLVSPGELIRKDQPIGKVGKSGKATGAHLHYEVRKGKNNPVDPSEYGDGTSPLSQSLMGAQISMMMGDSLSLSNTVGSNSASNTAGNMGLGNSSPKEIGTDATAYASSVLTKLGAPVTEANLQHMARWMAFENGWKNLAGSHNNPLNTTLDKPGAGNFNSVGVKIYSSLDEGAQATVDTLTGKSSAARGYDAIVAGLQSGKLSNSEFANLVNNSSWGTKIKGGGTPGYGASMPVLTPNQIAAPVHLTSEGTGAQTVNIVVKFDQANEQNAEVFAKRVQKILDGNSRNRKIGAK